MMTATTELGTEHVLSPVAIDKLRRFGHWLEGVTKRCYTEDPVHTIKEMISDLDYEDWLHQTSNTPNQAESRMKNVMLLVGQIERMISKADEMGDEMDIDDIVARLILRDMLENQEKEEELDQVQLMTLHASKGLEYPNVFILGLEEEILPHKNSIEAQTVEEERRLMYVGITRAKQNLTLTLSGTRKQFGEKMETTESRFLDELPKDDIKRIGFTEATAEEKQQTGRAALAGLRGILGPADV